MRKFLAATGKARYDPWERKCVAPTTSVPIPATQSINSSSNIVNPFYSEAWRYTGRFSRFNRFKSAFPGLGIATVAFAGYCLYEHFFMTEKHHH
jgi:NADH dehydrogenase (ubiquinone) 1 beta subcomplex subunit 3